MCNNLPSFPAWILCSHMIFVLPNVALVFYHIVHVHLSSLCSEICVQTATCNKINLYISQNRIQLLSITDFVDWVWIGRGLISAM